jgi:hypothetical protein
MNMRTFICGIALGLCLSLPATADAPATSLRPQPLPQALALNTVPQQTPRPRLALSFAAAPKAPSAATLAAEAAVLRAVNEATAPSLRPRLRPAQLAAAATPVASEQAAQGEEQVVLASLALVSVPRPEPRPRLVARAPEAEAIQPENEQPEKIQTVAAIRVLPGKNAIMGKKGSVCGDPSIRGEKLAPITSRVRGCGIEEPVRITAIDGVTLSQPAVINCGTARALKQWIDTGLRPAFGRKEVASLRVAASYACRPRNNIKGAKISEHGRGNAIDISAIVLANGESVSVAEDWRRAAGKPMKKAYRAACGTFGTTLGPEADRYHRDHMHFDIANQRGGAYCR